MKTSNRNTIQKKNDEIKTRAEKLREQILRNVRNEKKTKPNQMLARLKCTEVIKETKFLAQDDREDRIWIIIDDHSGLVLRQCYSEDWAFAIAEQYTSLGLDVDVAKVEKCWWPAPFMHGDHLNPAPEILE